MNPTDLLELDSTMLGGLPDTDLLDRQRAVAAIRRRADAAAAVIAAEIERRSRPELGHNGLAQRLGARTPALLVQQLTGSTAREANSLVRVGAHLAAVLDTATDTASPDAPAWLRQASSAVAAGQLSIDAFEAIRTGLGTPDDHITAADLTDATATLLARASTITVERLAADARDLRAALDLERLADTEQAMRQRRYLHLTQQGDGMTRLTALLDPESAATIATAIDAATSPRRGGPRFVDPDALAVADRLLNDPRTTEQIAVDALVELVRIGTATDDHILLGSARTVTVHVTATDLDCRRGIARIEGQTAPLSIATAERHVCDGGIVPIHFDTDGHVVNIGRQQRHFTHRQRQALAARDGGCLFPHCGRPPSWTEAHHIIQWSQGGRSDLDNGILLCRHHHLLVHNNGWQIARDGAECWLTPPVSVDPAQQPIRLASKQRVAREREKAHARDATRERTADRELATA